MGRRKVDDGSDQLPAMVRRKNAVNEELTLAAMSEDVWAAVESGKERRRRLACEREYGVGKTGAKFTAAVAVATPAKTTSAVAEVDASGTEKGKAAQPVPYTKSVASNKHAEHKKEAKLDKMLASAGTSTAPKKEKVPKDASKSSKPKEGKTPLDTSKPIASLATSEGVDKNKEATVDVKPISVKSSASKDDESRKQGQDQVESNSGKLSGDATSSVKPANLTEPVQGEETNENPQKEGKKLKRGKKKAGRTNEGDDNLDKQAETAKHAPAAPLAIDLTKMVSDERSPVTAAPLPLSAASPSTTVTTLCTSAALPTPSAPPSTPSAPLFTTPALPSDTSAPLPNSPLPTSGPLSYAEKAKHPPVSPPHEEPAPPPRREESPEPLYDPVPRAPSPPPAPTLAPCSPVTEQWLPVETRKDKRRRRRSERASESERKSESEGKSESVAEPDAFDLLLSGGEGLHDGIQEALEEEEDQRASVPLAAAAAPADAFDLLLSAVDDLGDGFQEAFGDEDDEIAHVKKNEEQKVTDSEGSTTKKQDEAASAMKQKPRKTGKEEDAAKFEQKETTVATMDAFDLMLGGGDGLHEGFEQAFSDDKVKEPLEGQTKGQVKVFGEKREKANKTEHKTSPSDKCAPGSDAKPQKEKSEKMSNRQAVLAQPASEQPKPTQEEDKVPGKGKKPRSRKNSEKAKEVDRTPRKSTPSDSEHVTPPSDSSEPLWFNKSAHDAAETMFYESITPPGPTTMETEPAPQQMFQSCSTPQEQDKPHSRGKKSRSRKSSEKTKQGRTPRESTCSESEPANPSADTAAWFEKAMYDAAETKFYEGLYTGGGQSENQQEVLKKTSVTQTLQPLSRSEPKSERGSGSCSSSQHSVEANTTIAVVSCAPSSVTSPAVSLNTASSQHTSPPSQPTLPQHLPSKTSAETGAPPPDPRSPPMSLSSQPEQYFEDVVLVGRQSAATMAALPGFTAAPLSERLAPGEQLDSLRTEPELEPDEPAEPTDTQTAAKKRPRRRRRKSDRTSESDRKSESERKSEPEETPATQPETVMEATAAELSPSVEKTNGEGHSTGKTAAANSKENGTEGKIQPKSNKSRNQRRKKTKSTSSTGDPPENGAAHKESSTTHIQNNEHIPNSPKVKSTHEAAVVKPPSVSTTIDNKSSNKIASPTTPAGSDSQPSSPEHIITSSPEHEGHKFVPDDEGKRYASLLQQDADMLPARPVFLAHACFVCKRLHSKQCRLKSCGSCRLVAYCSAAHQRAHWPLHRALCKVITKRMRKLGVDHLYREALNVSSHEQWKQIRFKHMTVCEEMLGRPMEAYEKEMFLYPRACETCHETTPEKLHTCHSCHSVSYCSEAHLRPTHAKFCKDLRLLVDIHTYQNQNGVCDPLLPDKMLTTYEQLPANIREFLVVSMLGPVRAYGMGNIELAVLSEQASYPLSMLYALQNIPVSEESHISQQTELTVHVVGAEFSAECDNVTKWDVFLLNVLPRLRRLHVVFIGPELEIASSRPGVTEEDFTCEACRQAGKRFTCEFQPSTYYHTYCRSPQFRPPHAICAFNAGIYRTTGHERRDSWLETIPHLVRDNVPLVLTAYTLLECPQDVARIQQEQKVDVLLPPMKNPYRSTRPAQNFLNEHESPLIYKNQYVACLTAARPRK